MDPALADHHPVFATSDDNKLLSSHGVRPHHARVTGLWVYISGPAGRPKAVMLDHANLDAMSNGVIEAFQLTDADHSRLILPLFHVGIGMKFATETHVQRTARNRRRHQEMSL